MNIEKKFFEKFTAERNADTGQIKIGFIPTTETFEVFNSKEERHSNLFTLGSNLKGELWKAQR